MKTGRKQQLPTDYHSVEKQERQIEKLVPQPQLATAFGFLI